MFPHKINGNFLHVREGGQGQRLLSPRSEAKFSLPEGEGAAFPWPPRSPLLREHPRQLGARALRGRGAEGLCCEGKGAFNGRGKLGTQLFSHCGLIIFFCPLGASVWPLCESFYGKPTRMSRGKGCGNLPVAFFPPYPSHFTCH